MNFKLNLHIEEIFYSLYKYFKKHVWGLVLAIYSIKNYDIWLLLPFFI